jgi:hypothetical protein
MEKFKLMLGMGNMAAVDSDGKGGGIAVLWRGGLNVVLRDSSKNYIDVDIQEDSGVVWRFTGMYGESKAELKHHTWSRMRELHAKRNLPWLCAGDFNEILFQHEKEGGCPRAQVCMDRFKNAMEDCELEDLGFTGDVFTWRNQQFRADDYIRERLDRALANEEWRQLFPLVHVHNGDPYHSDHRPVIIKTEKRESRKNRENPACFRFEASWLEEEQCRSVVEAGWQFAKESGGQEVMGMLKGVAASLQSWSTNVLGDLEKRLKKAKKDLENCRRQGVSDESVGREAVLRFKVDRIEEQIDTYWRQRAHVKWLEQGDRNTSFFHRVCRERKRRNRIGKLKKEDGGWVEDEVEKQAFITNHFMQLFTSNGNVDSSLLLEAVPPRVIAEMNAMLLKEVTREEIKEALDAIGDLKAPGPDGMLSVFYKRFWDVVGDQVTKEVTEVLNGGAMPERWNDTVIALIPKVNNPEKVTDLRPISLCNVLYKIISKVITNMLKLILPDIISPNQSAFVPGRLISDNILVAYEMTHYLRNKREGKKGYAAIKLDMSKAYDRVEWKFLHDILIQMGFHSRWVELIMRCVSTVNYSIKINGELSTPFAPERGLRQGVPYHPIYF